MKQENFDYICELVKTKSGLILSKDKGYLLESRLMPIARERQVADLDALAVAIRGDTSGKLTRDVVEAMTTNESFFFRDGRPFDQFRDVVLPRFIESRANTRALRIWSAACSNGQEPYTLAMIIREAAAKLAGWRIEIVGTDLSTEVLARAEAGLYSQFEVQRGLPITLLVKYFKQEKERWRIDSSLRSMITYRQFNLLEDPAPLGKFDVIFCRNVLIYFDQPTKTTILDRLAKRMPDDGILYLGGAETVIGVSQRFAPMPSHRGVYTVVPTVAAPRAATG